MSLKKSPFFELRSGSVDSLLFVVKTADLDVLRAELVKRFEATPEFFADDVVAIDVRRLAEDERVSLDELRAMLNDVRMRPIG
ncbi:septum site-determining protein MinC, partial [Burkholderia gladioli]